MAKLLIPISFFLILSSCVDITNHKVDSKTKEKEKENPFLIDSLDFKPIIFYPEEVSTNIDKFNTSFSPDSRTIYYTATSQKLGITGIACQVFRSGRFTEPEFLPFFSSDTPMADVQISPDGKQLLFSTFKDYEGKPDGFNFNIWKSQLRDGKWQDPLPFGPPLSSEGNEFYPVMTDNRTIYFVSDRSGNSDIYLSRYHDGKYQEPIALPSNINTDKREADAFIARDESYMIFVRVDGEDGFGNSDLYISFKKGENEWSDPLNMGENVNTSEIDGSPYVTPDGKHLIFTSGRKSQDNTNFVINSYENFKNTLSSSSNGSLNFYIMKLDLSDYSG